MKKEEDISLVSLIFGTKQNFNLQYLLLLLFQIVEIKLRT